MTVNQRSIELLQKYMHLLSSEKQVLARYVSENWPLRSRLPKGVAEQARLAYGRPVFDLAGAQAVARDLFLEAANLVHGATPSEHEA